MLTWTTEKRKISELEPAPYNPRKWPDKEIKDLTTSLKRFNLADPLVINKNNRLIGGHFRLNILKDNGVSEVDCRIPSRLLTEHEERELNLRLNRNLGMWDLDALANFDETMLKDVGFDSKELDNIFQLEDKPEADDVPEVRQTDIKIGDMFSLGQHRVLCGDCTTEANVVRLIGGLKAEMVFTDPPCNVDYKGGMNAFGQNRREGIENDKMDDGAFFQFLSDFIEQALKICDGAFYICMGNSQIHTLRNAFEQRGGHWQNFIIWVKHHFTITRGDYQHQYEPILYGWNKNTTNHYFVGARNLSNVWEDLKDIKTNYDGEYTSIKFQGFEVRIKGKAEGSVRKKQMETNIWRYDKPTKSEEHPTMKPVAMVEHAISNSSHREGIVYDPFLGSGSTLIACEQTNRICYGMEIDPIYCQVIIDRWEKFSNSKAIKLEN